MRPSLLDFVLPNFAISICLLFCLIRPATPKPPGNGTAQDLTAIGDDADTLRKQLVTLTKVVAKLKLCTANAALADAAPICQQSLNARAIQLQLVAEKLELLKLQKDPLLLTAAAQGALTSKLATLGQQFKDALAPALAP